MASLLRSGKQRLGRVIIPRLPLNRHVFDHFRTELIAAYVGCLHLFNPVYRRKLNRLRKQNRILLNIGSGPFGQDGWINLDLFMHKNVTLRADCRRRIPVGDDSCRGIHVEHFFEHLNHIDEARAFLSECLRVLEPEGVIRIVVPDAERFVQAYLREGWEGLREIAAEGDDPKENFPTKMEALNHVFLQGSEHYGGYDAETLKLALTRAGFADVFRQSWREGEFPGGPIDREQHRLYSLYMEAKKSELPVAETRSVLAG